VGEGRSLAFLSCNVHLRIGDVLRRVETYSFEELT